MEGEMRSLARQAASPEKRAAVVTKALLRAAELLDVKGNILSRVVGVSEPTLSRMRNGASVVEPNQKPFELAILFVRMYRSLDAIVGGEEAVARAWLKNNNTALHGKPIELIQSVSGLIDVVNYLDARRALV
jgi:hypothetical protein